MGRYTQLNYDIGNMLADLPDGFEKLPLSILSYALEIQDLLKDKKFGMTEDEIKRIGDNYFSDGILKELEELGIIISGHATVTAVFQKSSKIIPLNEKRYFLVDQEEK